MTKPVDRRELRRLRIRLVLFFFAVALPSALLLIKALDQLKWEALRQTQLAAEALTFGIDERLMALIRAQDARSFTDFAFLTLAGDPSAGFVQRSALASFPVQAAVPGLIGWFQIDDTGRLSTPLLPEPGVNASAYGIDATELAGRQALEQRIGDILARNALVARSANQLPESEPSLGVASQRASVAEPWQDEGIDSTSSIAQAAPQDRDKAAPAARVTAKSQAMFERLSTESAKPLADPDTGSERQSDDRAALDREMDENAALLEEVQVLAAGTQPQRASRREQAALPEPGATDTKKSAESSRERAMRKQNDLSVSVAADRADQAPESHTMPLQLGVSAPVEIRQSSDAEKVKESHAGTASHSELAEIRARPLIRTFESELDPFRFNLLDSGHFVLFRWAWRDGARYVQGALIESEAFLSILIADAFRGSTLRQAVSLTMTWDERPLSVYPARSQDYILPSTGKLLNGLVVYRGRLREPFGSLRLLFTAAQLPSPPGAVLVYWLGAILGMVLLAGTHGLYRLGLHQLALVRQQQDFVAAVSHELKTPLTSIRMHSEILQQGWVSDTKRERCYRYIQDESQRLSRLVSNVVQLARMGRDELRVVPRPVSLFDVMNQARVVLTSQAEQGGFELRIECIDDTVVNIDPDALIQVLINLVDNAIKFSATALIKHIEIRCVTGADGAPSISVRDYGPGIPKAERKRVFDLFQRLEQESTRDTKGTGIGLALVKQLMHAMGGEVTLIGREPGVEVRLRLHADQPKNA